MDTELSSHDNTTRRDFPNDWSLENFPHPNPFFPMPPRPIRWRGPFTAVCVFLGGVLSFASFPLFGPEMSGWVMILAFLTGCVCFISSVLILNDTLRARLWRNGRIVPARVLSGPKGPPPSIIWLAMDITPVVGTLMSYVAGRAMEARNQTQLVVHVHGVTQVYSLTAGKHWKYYRDNLDVWALLDRKDEPKRVELLAPRAFVRLEVPRQVSAWLDEVIAPEYQSEAEQHRQQIEDKEIKAAAKANTKAFKRATRG